MIYKIAVKTVSGIAFFNKGYCTNFQTFLI